MALRAGQRVNAVDLDLATALAPRHGLSVAGVDAQRASAAADDDQPSGNFTVCGDVDEVMRRPPLSFAVHGTDVEPSQRRGGVAVVDRARPEDAGGSFERQVGINPSLGPEPFEHVFAVLHPSSIRSLRAFAYPLATVRGRARPARVMYRGTARPEDYSRFD